MNRLNLPGFGTVIKISVLSFFFLVCSSLSAQTALREMNLKTLEPLWISVIGGQAVSPAVETSYGIAVLTDGRILSACTNSGTVIWQKTVSGKTSPYITAFGDFLFVVTDGNLLNMINPSGMTLWTSECPFEVCDSPVMGLDGRIFVRGEKGIACYGLNGIRKWHCETEKQSTLPMVMMDDGSVVVFLKNFEDGYQIGKRFSPFGEELDDLTFADEIISVSAVKKGLLVALKNRSAGLVSIIEGKSKTRWIHSTGASSKVFAIAYRDSSAHAAFFYNEGSSTKAMILDVDTGILVKEIALPKIDASNFQLAKDTVTGFFVSDSANAFEFYEDGTILWSAVLPDKEKWNHIYYTDANFLFICKKDWSMSTYRMSQTSAYSEFNKPPKLSSYVKTRPINSINNEYDVKTFSDEDFEVYLPKLKEGDYGKEEKILLEDLKYEAFNYQTFLSSKSLFSTKQNYFEANPIYTQNVFNMMALSGTADFSASFATMLKTEENTGVLLSLIMYAGNYGFDPEGDILKAFEFILLNRIQPGDTSLIKSLCDSTYKICVFMGRPVFNKAGKEIITGLMNPQYKRIINLYARDTLEKIVRMEKR